MPRVNTVKAAKDYPDLGIKKGDTCYTWSIKLARGGIRRRSKTYPRPSQLNLGFAGRLGDIVLDMEGADSPDALREFAENIRELGEEARESFDNMPEGLQQGNTGQLLEERADGLENWADEIESAADELESDLEEFDNRLKEAQEAKAQYEQDFAEYEGSMDDNGDTDMVEPDEPDYDLPEGVSEDDLDDEDKVNEARQELINNRVQDAQDANPGL